MITKFGKLLFVAISPAICGFAACGGKIGSAPIDEIDVASPDAGAGSDAMFSSGFDSGISFDEDGGAGFPPVENGPNDTTPACESRAQIDCSCHGEDCPPGDGIALGELVSDCRADGGAVCGYIYVDFDPDGCAAALRMDDPDPRFVACMTNALDAQRWPCAASPTGDHVMTYVDCTVP